MQTVSARALVFKLLIDTCVWLDVAKDARRDGLLDVLYEYPLSD